MQVNIHNVKSVNSNIRVLKQSSTGKPFYVLTVKVINSQGHETELSLYSDDKDNLNNILLEE